MEIAIKFLGESNAVHYADLTNDQVAAVKALAAKQSGTYDLKIPDCTVTLVGAQIQSVKVFD
jgi:hypothetical protein